MIEHCRWLSCMQNDWAFERETNSTKNKLAKSPEISRVFP